MLKCWIFTGPRGEKKKGIGDADLIPGAMPSKTSSDPLTRLKAQH